MMFNVERWHWNSSCRNSATHCDSLPRLSKDGLGHFPVVENFHEFVGNFLHRAKDFLQSDLPLVIWNQVDQVVSSGKRKWPETYTCSRFTKFIGDSWHFSDFLTLGWSFYYVIHPFAELHLLASAEGCCVGNLLSFVGFSTSTSQRLGHRDGRFSDQDLAFEMKWNESNFIQWMITNIEWSIRIQWHAATKQRKRWKPATPLNPVPSLRWLAIWVILWEHIWRPSGRCCLSAEIAIAHGSWILFHKRT